MQYENLMRDLVIPSA